MGLFLGSNLVSPAEYLKEEFVGIPREVSNQGLYETPSKNFTFSLPNDATNVVAYSLYYAFYNCKGLTSVDLSSLTTISGTYSFQSAFYNCTSLTSVDLSSLTTISGTYSFQSAFRGCTSLTSVDLSSLTTVSGLNGLQNAFQGCTNLASVDLSSLTTVSGNNSLYGVFFNCSSLTSVDLSSLTTLSSSGGLQYAFNGCTGLTSVSFPALTTTSFGTKKDQFNSMMQSTGSTKTHTIHFPSNLESTISGLTGYPLFGGTSGKVVLAFDLPATE